MDVVVVVRRERLVEMDELIEESSSNHLTYMVTEVN